MSTKQKNCQIAVLLCEMKLMSVRKGNPQDTSQLLNMIGIDGELHRKKIYNRHRTGCT